MTHSRAKVLASLSALAVSLLLSAFARAQPVTNNCKNASGPCAASTFTASQKSVSPIDQAKRIMEYPDAGSVQFIMVDGGYVASVQNGGASGFGTVNAYLFGLCQGNPLTCNTTASHASQSFLTPDSLTSYVDQATLGGGVYKIWSSAQPVPSTVAPIAIGTAEIFSPPKLILTWLNGNTMDPAGIRADGAICFGDGSCQSTAASSGVSGSGTATYIPMFSTTTSLSNSPLSFQSSFVVFDNGLYSGMFGGADAIKLNGGNKILMESSGSNYLQYSSSGINIVTQGGGVRSEAITVGGGTQITKILRGSRSSLFDVPAQTCTDFAAVVTGAVIGDNCSVGSPAAGPGTGLTATCYVNATDQISLRLCNVTGSTQTPTAGTYSLLLFH